MIITYLRSSSVSSYSWCQHKYWLTYNLGFKDDSNKKAEKGNVVHKALELLANKKLCLQNGTSSFFDNELKQEFSTIEISPESSIVAAYDHYKNKSIH